MDDRAMFCPSCNAWALRTPLFQAHGFRLSVPCKCGARVPMHLSAADLPRVRVDFEASTTEQLEAFAPVTTVSRLHEGVAIDADTPLWALYDG